MKKNIVKNVIMLYGLSIAKILFPLITLPYLTRVLSVDCYGTVTYVKTLMQYMQILVDFGFLLSGTKEIAEKREDKKKLEYLMGDILAARIALAAAGLLLLAAVILIIPILRAAPVYTLLSYGNVFLSVFLFDYYFRGVEKMQVITSRFVLMRAVSTALTFVLVHRDSEILWIPILDLLGSGFAIGLILIELKKDKIRVRISGLKSIVRELTSSFVYFVSDMATTAFGALNTILIGAFLPASDVAFWSVCIQLIGAIQTMYNPITSGVYPDMVRTKDLGLIKELFMMVMPVIFAGSAFTYFVAPYALEIAFGAPYRSAYPILRLLIPVLIFSFPGMLIGWPTLGAIGKTKEVTFTTIVTAVFQVAGLLLLFVIGQFNLIALSVLRGLTELVLLLTRFCFCIKYRNVFSRGANLAASEDSL